MEVIARLVPVVDLNPEVDADHDDDQVNPDRRPVLLFELFRNLAEKHGSVVRLNERVDLGRADEVVDRQPLNGVCGPDDAAAAVANFE